MRQYIFASAIFVLPFYPAAAFEKRDGYFIAPEACEAYQSKNRQTNPGGILTSPHRAYDMLGINQAGGVYFQIRMENAPVTTARWVSTSCGLHAVEAAMPGYTSFLHHHEWIKHGTCYFGEGGADEYYDDTLYLTDLVNTPAVGDLFFNNVGQEVSSTQIRTAFDQRTGAGYTSNARMMVTVP